MVEIFVSGAVSARETGIPTINTVNYAAGTFATPTFGYISNHSPSPRTLERYDYSNDTVDPVVKGTLSPGQSGGLERQVMLLLVTLVVVMVLCLL